MYFFVKFLLIVNIMFYRHLLCRLKIKNLDAKGVVGLRNSRIINWQMTRETIYSDLSSISRIVASKILRFNQRILRQFLSNKNNFLFLERMFANKSYRISLLIAVKKTREMFSITFYSCTFFITKFFNHGFLSLNFLNQ